MRIRNIPGRLAPLALAAALVGCSDPLETNRDHDPPEQPSAESWTVLVYMVADNNLEPFALKDIEEMAAVGSGTGFDFVLQTDRAVGYSMDGVAGLGDWQSAKRLHVVAGAVEELEDIGEPNMGDPAVLADFIAWGVAAYPADRYALVLWNHGGAWPSFGSDDSTPNGDVLDLGELKHAMADGLSRAGIQRFGLLGFDACLMATVEVALGLRPFADYLLASEETEPGHGWDYRALQIAHDDPKTDAVAIGKAIIGGFAAQAEAEQTAQQITLSLVDLGAMAGLEQALAAAAQGLAMNAGGAAPQLGKELAETLAFGVGPEPERSTNMVDLGDVMSRFGQAAGQSGVVDPVLQALGQVVLDKTAGAVTARATGMSIYFPPQAAYYNPAYDAIEEMAPWRAFLEAYYDVAASGAFGAPSFENPDHLADATVDSAGLTLRGTLAPGAEELIATASITYAVVDEIQNLVFVVGKAPASVQQGIVEGFWDLTVLRMTQGSNVGYAYLAVEPADGGYFTATIPFAYQAPNAPDGYYGMVVYVLDPDGNVLQYTYYVVVDGGFGEFTPEPGSTLMPLIPVIDGNGNTLWADGAPAPFDPVAGITLDFQALQTGDVVYAELDIQSFSGEGDYVYATGAL